VNFYFIDPKANDRRDSAVETIEHYARKAGVDPDEAAEIVDHVIASAVAEVLAIIDAREGKR
jgi:hypothetical protein